MTDFSTIDERLREIQSRLGRVVEGGAQAPAQPDVAQTGPPAAPAPGPPEQYAPAYLSQPAPEEQAAGLTAGEPPQAAGYQQPVQSSPYAQQLAERAVIEPAEARANAIIAAAEMEAVSMLDEARRQVGELAQQASDLKRQIDELVALRDRLERSITHPGVARQQGGAAAPRPGDGVDPSRFGGTPGVVSLVVGPFPDVASIEDFNRSLTLIPALQDIYIRAYESGRAIFELTVATPVALLDEIHRATQFGFRVEEESAAALVITLVEAVVHGGG
jgi:hypothetical protein